jgi:hypothetical protein
MKNRLTMISFTTCLFFAGSLIAFGQQPQSKAPVVTAEDVLRVSRGSARANPPRTPVAAPTAEVPIERNNFAEAESAWNARLKIAQQRVKELERRADATEIEINRLKNVLFGPERRSTQEHKGLIADIDNLTAEMRRLRAEAVAARVIVEEILDQGQAQGYRVSSSALTNTSGSSSLVFYRSRYTELQSDLIDAQSRADVLQLRANNLSRVILLNSRTGDEFYNNRVRENLRDMQEELYATQARVIAIRDKIAALRQEARAAGVVLN